MNLKMIVCVAEDFAIGKDNDLLFSLPPDMKFFREKTSGKTVVMGRATLDSFPGGMPLKNRKNIVLTRNPDFKREGALIFTNKDDVLSYLEESGEESFVIGGAEIYKMFAPYCSEAYVTKVRKKVPADKFFINIDKEDGWYLEEESPVMEHEGLFYTFCKYIKRND